MRGTLRVLSNRVFALSSGSTRTTSRTQLFTTPLVRPLSTAQPVEKQDRSKVSEKQTSEDPASNKKEQNEPETPSSDTKSSETQSDKKADEQKQSIPEVNSTALGLEDPDANDPYKWQKFAWKYAGAVLLFFISYKTLHWYVDRLEADGIRKREELEENKTISQEIYGDQTTGLANAMPQQGTPGFGVFQNVSEPAPQPLQQNPVGIAPNEQPVDPETTLSQMMPQYIPQTTSELDELYAYKDELENQLKELQKRSGSRENVDQKLSLKSELEDLEAEIAQLGGTK